MEDRLYEEICKTRLALQKISNSLEGILREMYRLNRVLDSKQQLSSFTVMEVTRDSARNKNETRT